MCSGTLLVILGTATMIYLPSTNTAGVNTSSCAGFGCNFAGVICSILLLLCVCCILAQTVIQLLAFWHENEQLRPENRPQFFSWMKLPADSVSFQPLSTQRRYNDDKTKTTDSLPRHNSMALRKDYERFIDSTLARVETIPGLMAQLGPTFDKHAGPASSTVPKRRRLSTITMPDADAQACNDVVEAVACVFLNIYVWTHRLRFYSRSWLGRFFIRVWFRPCNSTVGLVSRFNLIDDSPFAVDAPTSTCVTAIAFWLDNVASDVEKELMLLMLQALSSLQAAKGTTVMPADHGQSVMDLRYDSGSSDGDEGTEMATLSNRNASLLFTDQNDFPEAPATDVEDDPAAVQASRAEQHQLSDVQMGLR
jgi:hypothetical protein